MEQADGRYGYRAWDRRPGDGVDPSVALTPVETIFEVANQVPTPIPAGVASRFLGRVRTQPGIADVLGVGPATGLMQDTPTKQDSGMYPSGVNW